MRKEETRHSTERMRGLESLTEDSEGRDAIHRMINHPLWHDAPVTGVLLLDISLIFHPSSFLLNFPISAEALAGRELRRKFPLRNGDFLIASKMRSIRFRKFTDLLPTMIHRAVLAPPFWRQKVAETNV